MIGEGTRRHLLKALRESGAAVADEATALKQVIEQQERGELKAGRRGAFQRLLGELLGNAGPANALLQRMLQLVATPSDYIRLHTKDGPLTHEGKPISVRAYGDEIAFLLGSKKDGTRFETSSAAYLADKIDTHPLAIREAFVSLARSARSDSTQRVSHLKTRLQRLKPVVERARGVPQ